MKTDSVPQLSIVVLTHNRQAMLRDCLNSLIKQELPKEQIELVVVDDGSTDETGTVVQELQSQHPGLRYISQSHSGIPAARNRGIQSAAADIVAIVADDYIFSHNYAPTVLNFFKENKEARIVRFKIVASRNDLSSLLSHSYYEISCLNRLHPRPPARNQFDRIARYFRRIQLPDSEITTEHQLEAAGAAAFRRAVFSDVGLFDEKLLRGEDTDFTRRLSAAAIPVHYNPFHTVRHQYGYWCIDTIQKCFESGFHQCALFKKYSGNRSYFSQLHNLFRGMAGKFLRSIWGARQTENPWEFFLFFPGILLFELSMKIGYCYGIVRPGQGKKHTNSQKNSNRAVS